MSNRLEALRVFCVAADAANFREAAVRLSVSPQVVTRAVRELADELGEPLFHRSTRGVQLTDFWRGLAERSLDSVRCRDSLFHRSDRSAPAIGGGRRKAGAAPATFDQAASGRRFWNFKRRAICRSGRVCRCSGCRQRNCRNS